MNHFKYILFPNTYKLPSDSLKLVENAATRIGDILRQTNVDRLSISDYNRKYLKTYINSVDFYLSQYAQLMLKVLAISTKPINQSSFIDYGGGCGILSLLASEMGFGQIIYNDIYDVSTCDAKVIANSFKIHVDQHVNGDINELCLFLKQHNLAADYICSFDVLEHIYDWEKWFKIAQNIEGKPSFVFLTSANGANPFINQRLIKLQKIAELRGRNRTLGWKERDACESFLSIREKFIQNIASNLTFDEVSMLAKSTRGLILSDITDVVNQYIQTKEINYRCLHGTNTCDPYTGNWTENIIDTNYLITTICQMGYKAHVTNGFYSYSNNRIKSLPKMFLNHVIRWSGQTNLFFSPTYTLTVLQ